MTRPQRRDDAEFRAEAPAAPPTMPVADVAALRSLALRCGSSLPCEGATQIVPGEGNPRAALVIVGEAPGEQEDRQGRPFVGRSGKLLDQLLAEAGLAREDVWITNTVKCRPTMREGGRLRNRAPKVSEIKAWLPCLESELALIRPRLILGLGAIAGRALVSPDFKITQQRGQTYQDALIGAPLIVSWHPSYLLRQVGSGYDARLAESRRDFAQVARQLGLPETT